MTTQPGQQPGQILSDVKGTIIPIIAYHQLGLMAVGIMFMCATDGDLQRAECLVFAYYYIFGCFIWITHWLGHRRWFNRTWFRYHTMHHHVRDYPPSRFLVDRYLGANNRGGDKGWLSLAYWTDANLIAYTPSIPVTVAIVDRFAPLTASDVAGLSLFAIAFLIFQDYIHQEVHTRGSRWESSAWFQDLRRLHYQHHKGNCRHNYAMIDFSLDLLTGNFMNVAT